MGICGGVSGLAFLGKEKGWWGEPLAGSSRQMLANGICWGEEVLIRRREDRVNHGILNEKYCSLPRQLWKSGGSLYSRYRNLAPDVMLGDGRPEDGAACRGPGQCVISSNVSKCKCRHVWSGRIAATGSLVKACLVVPCARFPAGGDDAGSENWRAFARARRGLSGAGCLAVLGNLVER